MFGGFFRAGTWAVWRVFLAALFALPMTADQLAVYQRHTGRSTPPTASLHEAWLVCGRRGGKSFVLATIAVFLAAFKDWRRNLAPGEVGVIMIIAADRRQARVIMRYCTGLLKAVPMLAKLIEAETRETIELRNRITIEIHTASFRTTRGYTIVAALLDELAYWATDEASAEPDTEGEYGERDVSDAAGPAVVQHGAEIRVVRHPAIDPHEAPRSHAERVIEHFP